MAKRHALTIAPPPSHQATMAKRHAVTIAPRPSHQATQSGML